MGLMEFTCKVCGQKRTITPCTGFTCTKCKTRYSIGPDGKVRSQVSPKRK